MVERFNPPTRAQLSAMARGDERLIRALEQLWTVSGQDVPDIEDDTSQAVEDIALSLGATGGKVQELIGSIKELSEIIGKAPPYVADHPELYIPPPHDVGHSEPYIPPSPELFVSRNGSAIYNDTATATTPIVLPNTTAWTSLTNDGAGPETELRHLPPGVDQLMDTPSGAINVTQLDEGDMIYIRQDYTVTPSINNSVLEARYTAGAGGGAFILAGFVAILAAGSGVGYQQALVTHSIVMGNPNTIANPIIFQLRLQGGGTVVNTGSLIDVERRA